MVGIEGEGEDSVVRDHLVGCFTQQRGASGGAQIALGEHVVDACGFAEGGRVRGPSGLLPGGGEAVQKGSELLGACSYHGC